MAKSTDREYSGKVGVAVDVTEQLNVYGEVAAITTDQEFDTKNWNWEPKLVSPSASDSIEYTEGLLTEPLFYCFTI